MIGKVGYTERERDFKKPVNRAQNGAGFSSNKKPASHKTVIRFVLWMGKTAPWSVARPL